MRALLQRVSSAAVGVAGEDVGRIDRGLLVLLGLDKHDDRKVADRMIDKLLAYRMFSDGDGRLNCSVVDVAGGVLLVPQFTLAADTRKGLRPSFSSAMAPTEARELYGYSLSSLRRQHSPVGSGQFGSDMQVSLVNDGPVTFMLEVHADP